MRGYEVAIAEAGTELGGRVRLESRLPGLSAWSRVRDYRAHQIGFIFGAVGQSDGDRFQLGPGVGRRDHVVVGDDIAVSRDDEARTQRLRLALAIATRRARGLRHVALEELAEHRRQAFEVRHLPCGDAAVRQLLLGTDVDHRWRSLLDQRGEVRQGFLGLGGEHLAEHQHGGEHGEIGFQAWY